MEYTDQQRAIVRRMGEISARLDIAYANMRLDLLNFATELAASVCG